MWSKETGTPYRYITWRMVEFQMDSLKLALRVFPADLDRAIIFFLVARMSCSEWIAGEAIQRPAAPRVFSINALAASLSRPFETVRRHVHGMIDAGICAKHNEGFALFPTPERNVDIILYYRDTANLILRLAGRLAEQGIPIPATESVAENEVEQLVNAALDICLVALENNDHGHWFELALHGALIYENGRDIMGTPELAREYGNLVLTDEQRRPVRIRVLSDDYGIPYATVRRHVDQMLSAGMLRKKRGGFILNTQWTGVDEKIAQSDQTVMYLLKQFRALAAQGVDLLAQDSAS